MIMNEDQNPNIAKKFWPLADLQQNKRSTTGIPHLTCLNAFRKCLHMHGNVSKQLFLDDTVIVLCFFGQDGHFSWLVAASLFFFADGCVSMLPRAQDDGQL